MYIHTRTHYDGLNTTLEGFFTKAAPNRNFRLLTSARGVTITVTILKLIGP